MTKPEIRTIIRHWVRDIIPTLKGEYCLSDLYTNLRGLFNDNDMWDTYGKQCPIGDYMVRMEILRAKRLTNTVDRIAPGVYHFA